jgi:hypothetical protein
MAKDKWIGGAVRHKGSLTRAAKKHGRSTLAEAKAEEKSPNKKIASRGRLALRFMGKAKHGNIKKAKSKTNRKHVSVKA